MMSKNIHTRIVFFTLICLSLVPIPTFAESVTIDFESFPSGNGVLKDDVAVSNQYKDAYGIALSIDQDKNPNTTKDRTTPYLEQRGKQKKGAHGFFYNQKRVYDTEAAPYAGQLGTFFLRFSTKAPAKSNLLIELSRPATTVSGVLWDIDAASVKLYEQWKMMAYTRQNNAYIPIGSMNSPKGLPFKNAGTFDGRPYAWTFGSSTVGGADIYAILITFTGSKRNGLDVGFDQLTVMFKEEVMSSPVISSTFEIEAEATATPTSTPVVSPEQPPVNETGDPEAEATATPTPTPVESSEQPPVNETGDPEAEATATPTPTPVESSEQPPVNETGDPEAEATATPTPTPVESSEQPPVNEAVQPMMAPQPSTMTIPDDSQVVPEPGTILLLGGGLLGLLAIMRRKYRK